jgi:DNA polymerase-1
MKARARKRVAETLSGLLGTDAGVIETWLLQAFHQARQEAEARAQAVKETEALLDGIEVEPPAGPELLRATEDLLRQYVVFSRPQDAFVTTLWTGHTWVSDRMGYSPRLAVLSPAKRCGKTVLLSILARIVRNPLMAADVSAAYLVRAIDALKPTLLLDEAADWLVGRGPDREAARLIASVLRRGYRPGQATGRCEKNAQGQIVLQDFDPYCPAAFALIGSEIPDDALADRCIRIRLERKPRQVPVRRFIEVYADEDAAPTAAQWRAWAVHVRDRVSETYRQVLDWLSSRWTWLNDRAVEGWAALGTVLMLTDPSRFPELEAAARELAGSEAQEGPAELLLACIREVFRERGVEEIRTADLLQALNDVEARPDWPWHGFNNGKGLRADQLARMLRPFGVRPRLIWQGSVGKPVRGYRQEDFKEPWARYLDQATEPEPEPDGPDAPGDPADFLGLGVEPAPSQNENASPKTGVRGVRPVRPASEQDFQAGPESASEAALTGLTGQGVRGVRTLTDLTGLTGQGVRGVRASSEADSPEALKIASEANPNGLTALTPPTGGPTLYQVPLIRDLGVGGVGKSPSPQAGRAGPDDGPSPSDGGAVTETPVDEAGEPDKGSGSSQASGPAQNGPQVEEGRPAGQSFQTPAQAPTVEVTRDALPELEAILIRDPAGLDLIAHDLGDARSVAVDTETTGLNWRTDRLRVVSLTTPGSSRIWVIDAQAVDPRALVSVLKGRIVVGHNFKFDLLVLRQAGVAVEPTGYVDTFLAEKLLTAGTEDWHACGLAEAIARRLGVRLDKSLQTSFRWPGPLTQAQVQYAALDAWATGMLAKVQREILKQDGLMKVALLEFSALPAVVWLESSGVPFDVDRWTALAQEAEAEVERLARQVWEMARINPASPRQVLEALRRRGHAIEDTTEATLKTLNDDLARAVLAYRDALNRAGKFGRDFLEHVVEGRVYSDWHPIGAVTGRMSSSEPNLQNVPRYPDHPHRTCFRAPEGRVLIKADYSQIELRIAAAIAKDRRMLEAYRQGLDLHTLTAQMVLGRNEVTKEDRQRAKAMNFGLIYGMSAETLREHARNNYDVELSEAEAQEFRRRFFQTYRGIADWHERERQAGPHDVRTRSGRLVRNVDRFTNRLNTPVQGTGADGLKRAMALMYERWSQVPADIRFCLAVHDELVVECNETDAQAVADWLRACMKEGMQDLIPEVPVEVEVRVGRAWAGE